MLALVMRAGVFASDAVAFRLFAAGVVFRWWGVGDDAEWAHFGQQGGRTAHSRPVSIAAPVLNVISVAAPVATLLIAASVTALVAASVTALVAASVAALTVSSSVAAVPDATRFDWLCSGCRCRVDAVKGRHAVGGGGRTPRGLRLRAAWCPGSSERSRSFVSIWEVSIGEVSIWEGAHLSTASGKRNGWESDTKCVGALVATAAAAGAAAMPAHEHVHAMRPRSRRRGDTFCGRRTATIERCAALSAALHDARGGWISALFGGPLSS